jgi:hypothetical protein
MMISVLIVPTVEMEMDLINKTFGREALLSLNIAFHF